MAGNSKSGRKSKPIALHVADGTFRTTRHADTLQLGGLPTKPELGKAGGKVWDSLISILPAGMLASIDAVELGHYCFLIDHLDELKSKLKTETDDKMRLRFSCEIRQVGSEMRKFGDAFGMNPSARARIKKPDTSETNELSEFL